jgi:hypothetical protein
LWTPRWARGRWECWAYRAALIVVGLLVLHGAAINVLLLGGGLSRLIEGKAGGVVKLETGRSFSIWPGLVYLRDLHLEVIDSNVHLDIVVPRGRTKVRLFKLLSRQFATSSIVGEHFVVQARPKFERLSKPRQAALPPLEDSQQGDEGPSKSESLWGIDLAGIDATFDELWISELRYRGAVHIDGGFELRPLDALAVHDSRVVVDGGHLTYGPEQALLAIERARFDAFLPELSVNELASHWNERLSVALDVAGQVEDVAFVSALAPEARGLSGGEGRLEAVARAEGGRWIGDLRLEYETKSLRFARNDYRGQATARVQVHASADSELVPLESGVESLVVTRNDERLGALSGAKIEGQVTRTFPFPALDDVRVGVEGLALAGLESLRAFAVLPEAVEPRGGSILAKASARWHEGRVTGSARADFNKLGFGYDQWTFEQSGQVTLTGVSWKPARSPLKIERAAVDLHDVRILHPDAKVDSWGLALECAHLQFSPESSSLRSSFVTRSSDAKPALVLMGVRGLPPGVDQFLAMPDLAVRGKLELSANRQELTIERAESDTMDVKGRFVRLRGQNHAAVLFTARPLSLGVNVNGKESGFKLFAGPTWLEHELTQLPQGPTASRGTKPATRRSASPEAASLTATSADPPPAAPKSK